MFSSVEVQEKTSVSLFQLHWQQREGVIVVTPSDQDRFVVKVGKAIELLRQHDRQENFKSQFNLLIKELASWLGKHSGRWERAFLTAGENTLRFIVVRKQVKCEGDLTDSLSDLGVEIANDPDLDLIKLTTRALPLVANEELQSFLDPSLTIELNGDRS